MFKGDGDVDGSGNHVLQTTRLEHRKQVRRKECGVKTKTIAPRIFFNKYEEFEFKVVVIH